ncbi:hypothetical protein [Lysinibacter sp. HNR]|uniref:hypothetical protein n=1 Tax=Lysinibacter sp. HNR TaxID=3031408 RepID=UPI002434C297|nr:hypothetical protein [Lysinibacter sp. HNR]WGD37017.1 hypothetical protein FrondiHNR_11305 [Lysinibacter sp. HNR]
MRTITILVVAIVFIVGLWGVAHSDGLGPSTPAHPVVPTLIDAPEEQLVSATKPDTATDTNTAIGVVTCILGILCGFILAALLFFALRFRLVRFQSLRALPLLITFSSEFGHRGRHRFDLHHLSLLRI